MPKPADRDMLSQGVLLSLRRYLVSEGLQPGDRLPPERELAEELGVSRNTLREALRSLRMIGVVTRRPKHGSFLQSVDLTALAEVSKFMMVRSSSDLDKLFVARRLLEVNILPLVIQSATEEYFEQMERAIELMEAEINSGGFGTELDIEFHQALLASTGNHFLEQFGLLLQEYLRDPRTKMLVNEKEAREGLAGHKKLVRYLREGQVEESEKLMEWHIDAYVRRGVVHGAQSISLLNDNGEVIPADDDIEHSK